MSFDIDHYLGLLRVSNVAVSPTGARVVAAVARVSRDGKRFVSALWDLDPAGGREPRQLTRSGPGESHGAFLPDGSLLFTSRRPDPDADPDDPAKDEERSRLWRLPAGGGEAEVVASPPGGVEEVRVARDAEVVVYSVGLLSGSSSTADDGERAKQRKEKAVEAHLFEDYPIRYWDHYLGPRELHLFVGLDDPRDLTPSPGRALDEVGFDVLPDGSAVVSTWQRAIAGNDLRLDLVLIDTATGDRRVLATDDSYDFWSPAVSPDGRSVVCVRQRHGTPDRALEDTLWIVDLATGEGRDLTPDLDLWPASPIWTADGAAVLFTADERGCVPLFRLDLDGGKVSRLAADATFSSISPARDGSGVYALRSSMAQAPCVVAVEPLGSDQDPRLLPTPGQPFPHEPPGRVESVVATAPDGAEIQSWLVLPPGASDAAPAPLVVFVHGGPLSAWGDWSWRWNPHLLAARGYAVLLPNPALSTGFGQAFVQRGWGRWGKEPYTDILAAVDAAEARSDIDEARTALMGGSFGGYMANWIAGHTDRFSCIVTHAALWALDQFHGTTDLGVWWEHELGDPYIDTTRYEENSPHRHVANIRTPMLVIHGELDHRVPVAESLRLWTDLRRHGVEAKFLYFPNENHWVLKPPNVRVWYETVFAWLDHHVLGKEWERPPLV